MTLLNELTGRGAVGEAVGVKPLTPGEDFDYDITTVNTYRRAPTWREWNSRIFENISISRITEEIPRGYIVSSTFGGGRLSRIGAMRSVIQQKYGLPHGPITLLMQLSGELTAKQAHKHCHLKSASFMLLDGSVPCEMEVDDGHELILVQIPRHVLLSRHPHIADEMVQGFSADGPATEMVWNFVDGMARTMGQLDAAARNSILLSLVELLGAVSKNDEHLFSGKGHLRRASALIEERFCQPKLNALGIACELGVSRRRLDEIFVEATGRSVSAHIWERRLLRAALELRSPSRTSNTITLIALSMGFEDSAHFSRAFKKRFKMSPTRWRAAAGGSSGLLDGGFSASA